MIYEAVITGNRRKTKPGVDWHPAGRFLENSEVVDGLHWLWSDASSFYNGQELVLDSGLTQAMITPTLYHQDVGAMMAALAPADPAKEL